MLFLLNCMPQIKFDKWPERFDALWESSFHFVFFITNLLYMIVLMYIVLNKKVRHKVHTVESKEGDRP